jgi:hypothetical protein
MSVLRIQPSSWSEMKPRRKDNIKITYQLDRPVAYFKYYNWADLRIILDMIDSSEQNFRKRKLSFRQFVHLKSCTNYPYLFSEKQDKDRPTLLSQLVMLLSDGDIIHGWSQWPRRLKRELSSPARTLGSWVLIPLKSWMFVYAFILFVFSCV